MNSKTLKLCLVVCTIVGLAHAQTEALRTQKIDTSYFVRIGGIDQYISLKGVKHHPIVLYLHGGPGAAASAHSDKITGSLEQDFLVIHWDQRGAGNTLKTNGLTQPPTWAVMQSDADALLAYVLNTFHRKQLILVANSWGTTLAFHLAETHPKQISTLVAISPLVSLLSSQKSQNKMLIKHYRKHKNRTAVKQLQSINIPYQGAGDMAIQFRWLSAYQGHPIKEDDFKSYLQFFEQWYTQWGVLYDELYKVNRLKKIPAWPCRTIIFSGDNDYTAYYKLTKKFFQRLKVKEKEIHWFNGIGHQIPRAASAKMKALLLKVLTDDGMN